MKTKPEFLTSMQALRDNPEKIQAILKTVPKDEKEMLEETIKLALKMQSIGANVQANRPKRIATVMDGLLEKAKMSRPDIPSEIYPFYWFIIQIGKGQGIEVIKDEVVKIPYVAGYISANEAYNELLRDHLMLDDGGSFYFYFSHGLPPGLYQISLDWIHKYPTGSVNVKCSAYSSPPTAIEPQGSVDKVTIPMTLPFDSEEVDYDSMDMSWEVKAPNDQCYFCVKNNNGSYIASLGVDFVGAIYVR